MKAADAPDDKQQKRAQQPAPHGADGGSGTVGDDTEAQRQAGSYARDAEQDPKLGRDRQAAE